MINMSEFFESLIGVVVATTLSFGVLYVGYRFTESKPINNKPFEVSTAKLRDSYEQGCYDAIMDSFKVDDKKTVVDYCRDLNKKETK